MDTALDNILHTVLSIFPTPDHTEELVLLPSRSVDELRQMVTQKKPTALWRLGTYYEKGLRGVGKDEQKAFALYQDAASQRFCRGW